MNGRKDARHDHVILPIRRQTLWVQFIAVFLLLLSAGYAQAADPLPSWNDGAAKSAIIDYVTKVTTEGSPDFVPVAERIAVFDNDGTLWPENPMPFQMAFAVDEAKRLAAERARTDRRRPDGEGAAGRRLRDADGGAAP